MIWVNVLAVALSKAWGVSSRGRMAVVVVGAVLLSVLAQVGSAGAAVTVVGDWELGAGPNGSTVSSGAAMAYDTATAQMIMFGGFCSQPYNSPACASGYSAQTWLWSGTGWTLLRPATSPPGRVYSAMAYDPATRQLILQGGEDNAPNGAPLTDTWDWTGSNWVQLNPAYVPPTEIGSSMAFDPATGQLVHFGGQTGYAGSSTYDAETDTWTGTNWVNLSRNQNVEGRWLANLAWDPATSQFMLFGGFSSQYNELCAVWTWDGSNWTEVTPEGPANSQFHQIARFAAAMSYDTAVGQMILFGGNVPGRTSNDTWAWTGHTWAQLAPSTSPEPTANAAYAYDPPARQFVVYGGAVPGEHANYGTWLYVATDKNVSQPTATSTSPTTAQRQVETRSPGPASPEAITATTKASTLPLGSRTGTVTTSASGAAQPTTSRSVALAGRPSGTPQLGAASAPGASSARLSNDGLGKTRRTGESTALIVLGSLTTCLLLAMSILGVVQFRRRRNRVAPAPSDP